MNEVSKIMTRKKRLIKKGICPICREYVGTNKDCLFCRKEKLILVIGTGDPKKVMELYGKKLKKSIDNG